MIAGDATALDTVLAWMAPLAALASAHAALDTAVVLRDPAVRAAHDDAVLAAERGLAAPLLARRTVLAALALQGAGAVALGVAQAWWGAALGVVGTVLAAAHVRGRVNGGSDAMLFTVLAALAVACAPRARDALRTGAIVYVAAQCTASYLRAGVVKARERDWWTGRALAAFLALPAYGAPAWVPRDRALLRAAGIGVFAWELAAPLAWAAPSLAVAYAASAVAFHAANALVLGLPRFLLAWGAALPSLWFAATLLAR